MQRQEFAGEDTWNANLQVVTGVERISELIAGTIKQSLPGAFKEKLSTVTRRKCKPMVISQNKHMRICGCVQEHWANMAKGFSPEWQLRNGWSTKPPCRAERILVLEWRRLMCMQRLSIQIKHLVLLDVSTDPVSRTFLSIYGDAYLTNRKCHILRSAQSYLRDTFWRWPWTSQSFISLSTQKHFAYSLK